MSFYAYEDKERQNEVLAENVTDNNKLDEYFCPTQNCTAKLFIRSISGDRAANFAAKTNHPHSPSCRINLHNFKPTDYVEEQFDIDKFVENLLRPNEINENGGGEHGNGDGRERPISTVRQLYSMCINKSINQFYNNIRISDLLIDSRTRHIYYRYIRGFHLVECYCYRYDRDNRKYFARYWLDNEHANKLELELQFNDIQLFQKYFDKIFQRNLVVAGNWERMDDKMNVSIIRGRQIYPLPN